MVRKIKGLFFVIVLISVNHLNAQDVGCKVSEKIVNGKLAIEVANNKITSGSHDTVVTYFKMPSKSSEVNQTDWVSCEGFMPNGAKISSIEIIAIEGLPEGLDWYCDKEDCFYKGAETGCVTIEGSALKKGIYPLVIKQKGIGNMFGIKRTYDCIIKNLDIIVE